MSNTTPSQKFKDLPIGSTFRFASSLQLGYQGVKGPWIKLSPRKYAPEDDMSTELRIGSINASTVPVYGEPRFSAPMPLTAYHRTKKGVSQ